LFSVLAKSKLYDMHNILILKLVDIFLFNDFLIHFQLLHLIENGVVLMFPYILKTDLTTNCNIIILQWARI